MAVGANGQVFVAEQLLQLDAIGRAERTFEHGLGDLEPDPIAIRLRRVAAAGDLEHVERKLHHDVTGRRVGVECPLAHFGAHLRQDEWFERSRK